MSIDINTAWEELRKRVENCQDCELCKTRNKTVFGSGDINSRIVIIGEAPGKEEDLSGEPFVGPAGELLTKILENAGKIYRKSVYITNIVKCRPPSQSENKENDPPKLEYISACREFLEAQLLLLQPKIIVTMGNISTKTLTSSNKGITKLRGQWIEWRGIQIFPMFHPSYLIRNDSKAEGSPKWLTNNDIKALRKKIKALGLKEMLIDGGKDDTNAFSNNS